LTLQRANDDFGRRVQFNTVVSGVMELCNEIGRMKQDSVGDRAAMGEALKMAVLVISPVAPHIAHSLWAELGETVPLVNTRWPAVDEAALVQSSITLVVQVNGKVRAQIEVDANAEKDRILSTAKAEPNVAKHMEGKSVRKEIVVPNKLVNIVVG
jgi:leucyl-tRNA synthetase